MVPSTVMEVTTPMAISTKDLLSTTMDMNQSINLPKDDSGSVWNEPGEIQAAYILKHYVPIALLIVGTSLNIVAFTVFQVKNLKDIVNTLYYRSLVWSGLFILWVISVPAILSGIIDEEIETADKWSCRILAYLRHVGQDFEHWALSLTVLERAYGVFQPLKAMHKWTKGKAFQTFWWLGIVSLVFNIPVLFMYSVEPTNRYDICVVILPDKDDTSYYAEAIWVCCNFIVYIGLPFIIVLTGHIAIFHRLSQPFKVNSDNPVPMFLLTSMSKILGLLFLLTFLTTPPLEIINLMFAFGTKSLFDLSDSFFLGYSIAWVICLIPRCFKFVVWRMICPRFGGEYLKKYCGVVPEEPSRTKSMVSKTFSTTVTCDVTCDGQPNNV